MKREAVVDAFADVVVDGDVASGRGQHLAAAAGRGAEHDIAAGEGVAGRRHLPRFAAQDVEDGDAVRARRDLGERGDRRDSRGTLARPFLNMRSSQAASLSLVRRLA